ncbi:MurR/RpiR family transcriptional regulator [Mycoplasmatota bacterium]|nr:MurR/RpiR family transcriptional regulator [Mycoplasmatota bacterium]
MVNSIASRIDAVQDKMTKTDKIFLEYLKSSNYSDIVYLSITELSELSGVGEATILRFCRKLGLKGYQEFKLVLAQELPKNRSTESEGFFGIIADNMISVITETKDIIDEKYINEAVEMLVNSRRKYFFGLGNSRIVAMEAKARLMRIGFHVDALLDSHFMSMTTSTLTSEDVIVLVSLSGSTKDILEVAEIAKENGVKIIVITNYSKSPVIRYADIILYTVRKEGPLEGGSLISKISQLYLIDVLCTGITLYINSDANNMLEKTARAVVNKIL